MLGQKRKLAIKAHSHQQIEPNHNKTKVGLEDLQERLRNMDDAEKSKLTKGVLSFVFSPPSGDFMMGVQDLNGQMRAKLVKGVKLKKQSKSISVASFNDKIGYLARFFSFYNYDERG